MEIGSFYVVATPIGNLKDITLRAIEVLNSVDYVACEDTRVTRKLLEKYEISTKLFDYHKFNEKHCSEKIVALLEHGSSVALVSDAGTPGISDPGCILFEELNKKNIKINTLPGACAVSALLSVLSRDNEFFTFAGFIPKGKKQQEELFKKFKNINLVFYDSPNRLLETLKNIELIMGPEVKVAVGRELTKMFEEVKVGSVSEVIEYYSKNVLKGEIVAMIYAQPLDTIEDSDLSGKIKTLKSEGFSDKDISKIISSLFGVNKNKVYKMGLDMTKSE